MSQQYRSEALAAVRETALGLHEAGVMAEQGFPEEAQATRAAWQQGDRQKAVQLVPDPLIETVSVPATLTECRERVEAYRHAGIVIRLFPP